MMNRLVNLIVVPLNRGFLSPQEVTNFKANGVVPRTASSEAVMRYLSSSQLVSNVKFPLHGFLVHICKLYNLQHLRTFHSFQSQI